MPDLTQTAPDPTELRSLVADLQLYPGWTVTLHDNYDRGQGCRGLTLLIDALVPESTGDAYPGIARGQSIRVHHLFPVPAAAFNRSSWQRWLLDRFLDVQTHEACEFFRVAGDRVFAPHHSRGEDPYVIWQIGDHATASKRSTDG